MRLADLAGRRVGIVGFGAEGQSALARLAAMASRPRITVFNEHPLSLEPEGVETVVGPLDPDRLKECEVLIKSPGVSLYRPEIEAARAAGTALTSGTQLWFAEPRNGVVLAVSGSKGKSTTVALAEFLLRQAGVDVAVGGNIGVPLMDLWDCAHAVIVVELSSYQTADFEGRPEVALLTNLFPEHLDWHGGVERYYADKLKLFAQAPPVALVNGRDGESLARTRGVPRRRRFNHAEGWEVGRSELRCEGRRIAGGPPWTLPGDHNRVNLAAAMGAVQALEFDPRPGFDRLVEFRGLPHRLEHVGTVNGVVLIDDSIATAPEATVAALQAVEDDAVAVIVGGHDRGLDWTPVARQLLARPVRAVITQGASGPRIARFLAEQAPAQRVIEKQDLAGAVAAGLALDPLPRLLLLSPGAPSYDQFPDYRERGRAFRATIEPGA